MKKSKIPHTWKERREKRIREENNVKIEWAEYKDEKRNDTIFAFTIDLSIGGAKILTDVNFPVDSFFMITLTLSRTKQVLAIPAKVRWANPVHEGELFEAGLEFMHENPRTISGLFKHLYGKDLPSNVAEGIAKAESKPAYVA